MAIERFRGDYYFLSSMYPIKEGVETPGGLVVPTVEHLYQLSKFVDEIPQQKILAAKDGYKAKQLADNMAVAGAHVRADWPYARVDIMRNAVHQKFTRNKRLAYLLEQTGDEELIEGNTWGDEFWGVSLPEKNGLNWLGRILMDTRDTLRDK